MTTIINDFDESSKFIKAMNSLKTGVQYVYQRDKGVSVNEELFNKVKWITGETENGHAITTTDNPHSELTWTLVEAEMTRLQAEYDAQDYARKRKAEYPSIEKLVVALYDSEDKTSVDAKRAEIKLKYPKPGA